MTDSLQNIFSALNHCSYITSQAMHHCQFTMDRILIVTQNQRNLFPAVNRIHRCWCFFRYFHITNSWSLFCNNAYIIIYNRVYTAAAASSSICSTAALHSFGAFVKGLRRAVRNVLVWWREPVVCCSRSSEKERLNVYVYGSLNVNRAGTAGHWNDTFTQ